LWIQQVKTALVQAKIIGMILFGKQTFRIST